MLFDDADDLMSPSSTDYFESPMKAKQEAWKQKLKKEGLQHVAKSPSATSLRGLKLSVLRNQVDGKKDQQKKSDQDAKERKGTSAGTKTREQELAQAKDVDTHPSASQVIKQDAVHQKQAEEIKKQEVQGEGG